MFDRVLYLFVHEIRTDFRRKREAAGMVLYGFSLLFLVGYSAHHFKDPRLAIVLYWLLMVFSCLFVGRKLFSDSNPGSNGVLYSYYHPLEFFVSRWLYSLLTNLILACVFFVFFTLWFNFDFFICPEGFFYLLSGIISLHTVLFLSSSFTMVHEKGSALSLLAGIPLIVPVIMILLKAGFYFADGTYSVFGQSFLIMLWSVWGISFALSLILFPYLWKS